MWGKRRGSKGRRRFPRHQFVSLTRSEGRGKCKDSKRRLSQHFSGCRCYRTAPPPQKPVWHLRFFLFLMLLLLLWRWSWSLSLMFAYICACGWETTTNLRGDSTLQDAMLSSASISRSTVPSPPPLQFFCCGSVQFKCVNPSFRLGATDVCAQLRWRRRRDDWATKERKAKKKAKKAPV